MLKRKHFLILIIIAMTLIVLNFDFSSFNIETKNTWLFLAALIVLIASIVLLFKNKKTTNTKTE